MGFRTQNVFMDSVHRQFLPSADWVREDRLWAAFISVAFSRFPYLGWIVMGFPAIQLSPCIRIEYCSKTLLPEAVVFSLSARLISA